MSTFLHEIILCLITKYAAKCAVVARSVTHTNIDIYVFVGKTVMSKWLRIELSTETNDISLPFIHTQPISI